jgi:hypothetical protein
MTRVRMIASIVAFALAVVLLPVGIIGYWAQRTVTDSERYIETVGPLSGDPAVQDALAVYLADRIEAQINPDQVLDDIFGDLVEQQPQLALIKPILIGAIDSLINEVTLRIVQSEQFQGLWDIANRAAQQSLMAILEGRAGPVGIEDDQIVLDTTKLFEAIQQGLVDRGFSFAANIKIPETDQKIVLLQAPQLAQIRTIYAITSPVLTYLLFAAIGLFVLSVALARRRPRTTALAGGAVALIGLTLVIGLNIGRSTFDNTLLGTPFGPASTVFYDQLFSFLINAGAVTLLLGVIIAVSGWWQSRSALARELRGAHDTFSSRIASALPDGPVVAAAPWVLRQRRWLHIAIAAVFTLIVVVGNDLSVARTLLAALIALIALEIVSVLSMRATQEPVEEVIILTE